MALIGGVIAPLALATASVASAGSGGRSGAGTWVTSWGASLQAAVPGTPSATGFRNQTIRNIVFTSVGGHAARVQLANTFGTTPLQVGHVTIALAGPGASVVPGTVHDVTFGDSPSIEIPAGAQVLSDPVRSADCGAGCAHAPR
jgi:hypothetical protein